MGVSLTTPNIFGVTGSSLWFNGTPAGEPNLGTTPAGRASYPINQRVRLNAGDTVELYIYSDTGGTMTGGNSYLRVIRVPDRRF
jgi:hypothetical protein